MWIRTYLLIVGGLIFMSGAVAQIVSAEKEDAASEYVAPPDAGLEFAQKYHVTSAHFTAIGAVNGATVGWFDPQRKMYKKIPIQGQHEVIGMSGDIALYQGKPVVNVHAGGEFRWCNAGRSRSRCVCIPDAGSNGQCRSGNDAEAF